MDVQQFCQKLLEHAGIVPTKITSTDSEKELVITIQVSDEEAGLLVGRHGETLTALQRLARVLYGQMNAEKRLVIDVNDYRARRMDNIRSLLVSAADKVLETKQPTTINTYLSPPERFFVHSTLSEEPKYAELESFSIGEDRGRRIIIQLKENQS